MNINELYEKSTRFNLALMAAKESNKSAAYIQNIARQAALFEGKIAAHQMTQGDSSDKIFHTLTNQARCLVDAGDLEGAKQIFEYALTFATGPNQRDEVFTEIKTLICH